MGDAYATQGFTVKAIAMYKKISKLKPSLECVLKLAELYTQQGLFNDARAQYLQVADEFLKVRRAGKRGPHFPEDPGNGSGEHGHARSGWRKFMSAWAKRPRLGRFFPQPLKPCESKGSLGGAEEMLQRMLTLDPANVMPC